MGTDEMHSSRVDEQSVTYQIVKKVSACEGISPAELKPPKYDVLYDTIDTEVVGHMVALDRTSRCESNVSLEFEYAGYDIEVGPDGSVMVDE